VPGKLARGDRKKGGTKHAQLNNGVNPEFLTPQPKGARFGFLASFQDAWHNSFFTGGAPVGDHRLISAILSG